MAATAEPMDDELPVAGPLPLSRLEVKICRFKDVSEE
jgi:hypothetical protein